MEAKTYVCNLCEALTAAFKAIGVTGGWVQDRQGECIQVLDLPALLAKAIEESQGSQHEAVGGKDAQPGPAADHGHQFSMQTMRCICGISQRDYLMQPRSERSQCPGQSQTRKI